jgi:hypothetical protein
MQERINLLHPFQECKIQLFIFKEKYLQVLFLRVLKSNKARGSKLRRRLYIVDTKNINLFPGRKEFPGKLQSIAKIPTGYKH